MELKSGGSRRAVARSDVVALARYWTVIALGIQRWVVGTVASISMPMAISAALHEAMACTVCRWLFTKKRLLPADEAHDCVVGDGDIGPHDPDRMTGGDTRLLKKIAFNDMPGSDSHLR